MNARGLAEAKITAYGKPNPIIHLPNRLYEDPYHVGPTTEWIDVTVQNDFQRTLIAAFEPTLNCGAGNLGIYVSSGTIGIEEYIDPAGVRHLEPR